MLALLINASLTINNSVTTLSSLFEPLPLELKLFLFLVSPFAPISAVKPPL